MTSASAALPQQPGRTKAFLRLVMIEHSVFALPFAYIAALTAMYANGSANTECSIITSRRNARTLLSGRGSGPKRSGVADRALTGRTPSIGGRPSRRSPGR